MPTIAKYTVSHPIATVEPKCHFLLFFKTSKAYELKLYSAFQNPNFISFRALTMDGIGTVGRSLHVPTISGGGAEDISSIGASSAGEGTTPGQQPGSPTTTLQDKRSKVMEMLGE